MQRYTHADTISRATRRERSIIAIEGACFGDECEWQRQRRRCLQSISDETRRWWYYGFTYFIIYRRWILAIDDMDYLNTDT
jgi:hypothetical protein